jgi:small subunit ribosomal protein S16
MVVIRLARFGAKHNPQYRITVADSRRWLKGRFIEILGSYNPMLKGEKRGVVMDLEKVNSWIAKGAQPSVRVQRLIKQAQTAN